MAKIPNFFHIDPIRSCLTRFQLFGMHLFIKIQDLLVDVLHKNPKNGHFQPKMAKNGLEWPKLFFFIFILHYPAKGVSN